MSCIVVVIIESRTVAIEPRKVGADPEKVTGEKVCNIQQEMNKPK